MRIPSDLNLDDNSLTWTAEQLLLHDIIGRAFGDLVLNTKTSEAERTDAVNWLSCNLKRDFSFWYCCEHIGLSIVKGRYAAIKILRNHNERPDLVIKLRESLFL